MMIDLDGTLFDTKEVNYKAYQEAIKPYGYNINYDYYCEFCNGRHYLDFLPQITTNDEKILREIHNRKKILYSNYLNYARVNEALVDIIKTCRKEYKRALVTTASKHNTYDILEKFELVDLFDLILTNENVKHKKPDPEGYLMAMDYFKVMPKDCIIFEDSEVGICAAERSGANIFIVKGFN